MKINDFIIEFASVFEETDVTILKPETNFRSLPEWGSLTAMSVIALIDSVYNVKVNGNDIRGCSTIRDLFNIVNSRI